MISQNSTGLALTEIFNQSPGTLTQANHGLL